MLKVGIIEDVLVPLLKQLDSAKDLVLKLKQNDDIEMKNMFGEIEKDVYDIKSVLLKRQECEIKLMDKFMAVNRHVENILDGVTNETKTELQAIGKNFKGIKEKLIPPPGLVPITTTSNGVPSGSSPNSTLEIGESSMGVHLDDAVNYAPRNTAMTFSDETINKLDPQLRDCLFCLVVFPENSVVKKRLLIYWWIGLGLVDSTKTGTAEENGKIIFMELINTGLVVPIYRKHNRVVDRCRVQSHIRKLMMFAAEDNRFLSINPEKYKESTLTNNKEGTIQIFSTKKVRNEVSALYNIDRKYLKFEERSYEAMRNMTVVQIGRWHCLEHQHIEAENTAFFKGLGTGLKYLSLQGISSITELPDSIGKLTNLIILDLRACHNLERLTVKLTLLKNLTHLDVSKCYLLDHMPKGLGSLTNLLVLKGFVIGNRRSKDPCRLSELSRLTRLRKLSINIGHESTITEGDFKKLKEFTALRSLTITWGVLGSERDSVNLQLSAPEKLEKLDIRRFPSAKPPAWLHPTKLGSLKRLYIRGGKLAQLDNKDDGTWEVEVLRLRFLNDFVIEWSEMHRVFPNLLCVEYWKCSKLKDFPHTDGGMWVKEEKDDKILNSGATNTSKKDESFPNSTTS